MSDLEKAQREEARWRILKTLDAGRPTELTESLILRVLQDVKLPITAVGLRRELDYLQSRKLVEVKVIDDVWTADLTHYGIDLVEYTVECFAGIARPPKR